MEGMWSRFHPAEQALRALLRSGAIGEPLMADARLTFRAAEVRGFRPPHWFAREALCSRAEQCVHNGQ